MSMVVKVVMVTMVNVDAVMSSLSELRHCIVHCVFYRFCIVLHC